MNAHTSPPQPAPRLQWMVVAYFVVGVSLSGLFVSAASVWVAFTHPGTMHEEVLSKAVQGRRAVIEQYVSRIKAAAAQMASRIRPREALQAYGRGELSFEALVAITAPILQDAQVSAANVLGLTRFDRHGRAVVSVGVDHAHALAGLSLDSGVGIGEIAPGGEMVLLIKTHIMDRAGSVQGTDVVVFSLDELRALTRPAAIFGVKIAMRLGHIQRDTVMTIANGNNEQADLRAGNAALSSFGYLKQLPVEFVKVDGMFVREIGVDHAQGYGVGRPRPMASLELLDNVPAAQCEPGCLTGDSAQAASATQTMCSAP